MMHCLRKKLYKEVLRMKFRSARQVVMEIQAEDPETRLTYPILLRWIKEGKVYSVKVGSTQYCTTVEAVKNYMSGNQT